MCCLCGAPSFERLAQAIARFGRFQMCYEQKCQRTSSVRSLRACEPADCNNVGICNSRSHCHCDWGYDPRKGCRGPGEGGSLDSGPPGVHSGFNVWLGVLIFMLVIVPISLVLVTFIYRKKKHWCAKNK